jgi:hypothetical protein
MDQWTPQLGGKAMDLLYFSTLSQLPRLKHCNLSDEIAHPLLGSTPRAHSAQKFES